MLAPSLYFKVQVLRTSHIAPFLTQNCKNITTPIFYGSTATQRCTLDTCTLVGHCRLGCFLLGIIVFEVEMSAFSRVLTRTSMDQYSFLIFQSICPSPRFFTQTRVRESPEVICCTMWLGRTCTTGSPVTKSGILKKIRHISRSDDSVFKSNLSTNARRDEMDACLSL